MTDDDAYRKHKWVVRRLVGGHEVGRRRGVEEGVPGWLLRQVSSG